MSLKSMKPQIVWQDGLVGAEQRAALLRQSPATLWMTGLSGAGKSTLAFELEKQLLQAGHACFVLDGDNVRHGLSQDLGFSQHDRRENIRRIAEVAKLMNAAGLIVIASFISPYRDDRSMAQSIIGHEAFREIYISTSLESCEQRDTKGLYQRARAGLIRDFTGISAPYEPPRAADLSLDTAVTSLEASVQQLLAILAPSLHK